MTCERVRSEALAAHRRGWSVVPMSDRKHPAVKWKAFQTDRAELEMVSAWFRPASRFSNWGIIHGSVSGTVLIDLDNKAESGGVATVIEAAFDDLGVLPETLTVETPSGGLHLFFNHGGIRVPTRKNVRAGLDVRGDGGFSVGAGSRTERGFYRWVTDPDTRLADLPDAWLRVLTEPLPVARVARQASAGSTIDQTGIITEDRICPFGGSMPVVVDGRETHALKIIWRTLHEIQQEGLPATFSEIHHRAWARYRATTCLERPSHWSFEAKITNVLKKSSLRDG